MERGGSSNNKGMARSAIKIRGRSPSWNREFDPTPMVNERTEATAGRKKAKKREGENPTQGWKKRGGERDDQCIPMGSVTRIMRRVLPEQAKVSDDAKEAIQQCVTEFISFVTREANTRCRRDYRSTISPDDLVSTMAALGFNDYVEPLTVYLNKHRAQDPLRAAVPPPPAPVARPSPLSPPPAPVVRPSPLPLPPPPAPVVKPSPMPPPMPQMDLFPPSPTPAYVPSPPAAAVDDDCFGELPLMRDYFVDNHGGREGSEFDPFN